MTFPGLLNFDPLKSPLAPLLGSGGSKKIGSNQSHIYPNMCAKYGCTQTIVNAMLVHDNREMYGISYTIVERTSMK